MSDTNVSSLVAPGTARADIAAAVRAHIAVRRTNDSQVARAIGMSQAKFSRRTNEQVAFDADDLGRIATHFGIEYVDLVQMPKMVGGGGAFIGATPARTLKLRTSDYSSADAVIHDLATYRQSHKAV